MQVWKYSQNEGKILLAWNKLKLLYTSKEKKKLRWEAQIEFVINRKSNAHMMATASSLGL